MAAASMFGDVKSNNPAVIGGRKSEVITAIASIDRIKKDQTLNTTDGAPVNGTGEADVDVKSINLFRGGRGGGFTSELSLDYNMGSRTDKLTSTAETQSQATTANNSLAYLGFGFFNFFGLSYTHALYKNEAAYSGSFGGQAFSMNMQTDVTAQGLKAGFAKDFGFLDFGAFFQRRIDVVKSTVSGASNEAKSDEDVAGAAIGTSSHDFHFELGYEKELKAQQDANGNALNPWRATATLEARFGKLALGYTGRYYVDGFFEIERVIYNQFVYANSYAEPRLDNTFNFSYGSDRGSVFSGSISYSSLDVKETSALYPTGGKVPTKTTAMGASIKYSYAF